MCVQEPYRILGAAQLGPLQAMVNVLNKHIIGYLCCGFKGMKSVLYKQRSSQLP